MDGRVPSYTGDSELSDSFFVGFLRLTFSGHLHYNTMSYRWKYNHATSTSRCPC